MRSFIFRLKRVVSGTHNFDVSELKYTYSCQSFRNLLLWWIRKRSLIDCGVVFLSLFLRCSPRQHTFAKLPNIKTYAMTKSTRKFVNLYQSRDRRLVLYFLLLSKNRWMFRFSFIISKSWPATETSKLQFNTMYLPVRLILAPWRTTKVNKWHRLSFDLLTAAVDRDDRARTKKIPSCLLPIKMSRSVHRRWKQSA